MRFSRCDTDGGVGGAGTPAGSGRGDRPENLLAFRVKLEAREALPNTTAMARADSLFIELTGTPRELLGHAIAVFRGALDAQDPDPIAEARRQLLDLVEDIEHGRMRPPNA